MSTIRSELHTNLISQVIDDLFYQRSNFYYFLGKIQSWVGDPAPEDTPNLAPINDIAMRDNIVYMRRVGSSEVSIVTTRYDWEEGVVYDQWDHTTYQKTQAFYVVTDEFTVYKCLSNNNGAPSTIKPTGTQIAPIVLSDGYIWKYMYSVPAFKRKKFLSGDYLPVQRALTDGFYSRGAVEQVVVVDGGSGYTDVTQVALNVVGDGTGAVLTPVISKATGAFLDIIISDGGENYTEADINIVSLTGQGAFGNPTAILKPIVYNGSIVRVTIEDPGVNYPADLSTTIVAQGDGTGALFTPVVVGGEIIDVIVENPGQNYSTISLSVIGTGSGARLTGVLSASDFLSDQSVVEQSAVPGAIYAIKVTSPGNNYTENSTVVIEGDGTGATAIPVVNEAGGIEKVIMTNYGFGYTYANITITDPNRLLPNNYFNATAYAILPPVGGHGSDAVKELYGDTLAIFTLLQDDVDLNLIAQDYRQYGLLVNPLNIFDNKKITTQINFVTFKLTMNNTTGISPDDILVCNDVRYRVVNVVDNKLEVQQLRNIYFPVEVNDVFVNSDNPLDQYGVAAVDAVPLVNKYSGNLLYVSNTKPFKPVQEQLVSIRTFIKL